MSDKIRVLVVDDSSFARISVTKSLESDDSIEVVGNAKDGVEAIEQVKSLRPNVVTLDVSMPNMDGLKALSHIMAECPTPVVMLSALTGPNTSATLESLEKGAVDFFLKGSIMSPAGDDSISQDLVSKVKTAATVRIHALKSMPVPTNGHIKTFAPNNNTRIRNKVLIIGSSTGGPRALAQIVPAIPADISASVIIVQHMPGGFTRSLAERLNNSSQISVKEAEPGDKLERGKALMAPGGYHMVVDKHGEIALNQGPHVCGVRPSLDVTMQSIAKTYGNTIRAVVLTGMGSDGTNGCEEIVKAGGEVSVEHESTCAVYGMPRSIVEAGLTQNILPLQDLPKEIVRMCGN